MNTPLAINVQTMIIMLMLVSVNHEKLPSIQTTLTKTFNLSMTRHNNRQMDRRWTNKQNPLHCVRSGYRTNHRLVQTYCEGVDDSSHKGVGQGHYSSIGDGEITVGVVVTGDAEDQGVMWRLAVKVTSIQGQDGRE